MWDICLYKLKVLSYIKLRFLKCVEYMMSCPLMLFGEGLATVLEWKVKKDILGFNWIRDDGVYCSRRKDVRCKVLIFCTLYIHLDVVRIYGS